METSDRRDLRPVETRDTKETTRMYPFDQNNRQMYERYAQAHESGNHEGIDPQQAYGHVQQFMQQAPPEMQQQVYQQHFEQMPYEQRQQFAQQAPPQYQPYMDPNNPRQMGQGFYQMGQQQPGILQQLLGAAGGRGVPGGSLGGGMGGLLSNPMAKAALVGIAGLAAKQLLGGHRSGGLGGGLGGLLGGGQGYGYGGRVRDDRGDGWGGDRDDDRGDND